MENGNFVSAVVCTFNEEKHIQECVRSIIESDSRIGEVIIVDDNSTDQTRQKVLEMQDYRIKFYIKNGKNEIKGKNASIFIGAKLARYENLIMIDADTYIVKVSQMIDMLVNGADLVGGIISIREDGRLLAHCEAVEYNIAIRKARPLLFREIKYINTISGAFYGIKKKRIIENEVPGSVVGEDMYLTQKGIIQKWNIQLSEGEAITYAIPSLRALFIQRCRWIYGCWTVIHATGRKVPLIEMSITWYRTMAIIIGVYTCSLFTIHDLELSTVALVVYFLDEYFETHSIKDALLMMLYRQINFISAVLFPIFGRKWKVLR